MAHARLLSMEGLRGLAVLLVFLQHYAYQMQSLSHLDGISRVVIAALRSYGNLGVELFFVLSGYLIYGSRTGSCGCCCRRPSWSVWWRRCCCTS